MMLNDALCFWLLSGAFKLTLEFNEDYPNKAPKVRFLSKMFHPNGGPLLDSFQFMISILTVPAACSMLE
jgi:hypothetical protein